MHSKGREPTHTKINKEIKDVDLFDEICPPHNCCIQLHAYTDPNVSEALTMDVLEECVGDAHRSCYMELSHQGSQNVQQGVNNVKGNLQF